jgi:chromosomal replication initiation ATPase DnaA
MPSLTPSTAAAPPAGSLAAIAEEIAILYGVSVAELRTPTRERRVARPRQHAMCLMRRQRRADGARRYSCQQIANYFGLKDHTTVVYAVRAHERRAGGRP